MANGQARVRSELHRISKWAAAIVGAGGVFIAAGCGSTATPPAAKTATVPIKAPVKFAPADLEMFVIKSGKPFIQVNLYPELDALRALQGEAAQAYLCRRAAKLLVGKGLARAEYQNKDSFVIRLIVLSELDEYGKPKWGQSNEVARLTAHRAAIDTLTPAEIDGLADDRVIALFAEKNFSGEAVARR